MGICFSCKKIYSAYFLPFLHHITQNINNFKKGNFPLDFFVVLSYNNIAVSYCYHYVGV